MEDQEIAAELAALVKDPEMLVTQVFIDVTGPSHPLGPRRQKYVVKSKDGQEVLAIFTDDDMKDGESVKDKLYEKFRAMVCGCGSLLLDGEQGVCGKCEAEAVMSLLRMRDS